MAQNTREDGMECTGPHIHRMFTDKLLDAMFHFLCSLVRERERKNLVWLDAVLNKLGNPKRKHPCFAAPRTGDNHHRTVGG